MVKNNGRFLSTSIALLTFALLYTAPVSAQTLHPEHLFEKNRVVASYALLEEDEEVEIDNSDDLDAVKDEVADWIYRKTFGVKPNLLTNEAILHVKL